MAEAAEAPDVSSFATVDLDRAARRGYPEAVYCEGKTPEQVAGIAAAVRHRDDIVTLFTRAGPAHAKAILHELPDARHDVDARLLAWPPTAPEPSGGLVVVAAGTSDLPVAREALLALPTSVGYGAAFQGLAALLAMLNACTPGIAVVNIDNGYGAGHLAVQIAAPVVMDLT
jgi:NCAIR mutase (PurE)-related protein